MEAVVRGRGQQGARVQSDATCELSGVSVAGNISTLACMKERSGRAAMTLAASSLRFSSFLGFLSNEETENAAAVTRSITNTYQ